MCYSYLFLLENPYSELLKRLSCMAYIEPFSFVDSYILPKKRNVEIILRYYYSNFNLHLNEGQVYSMKTSMFNLYHLSSRKV